jgi:hypothetical protein
MAKMGLSVRDDPKKEVDVAGRAWGEPVHGLVLSLLLKTKEDPDELPAVSIAILNRSSETKRLTTRGWLDFFHVSVTASDGDPAPPTSYGAELMKPERQPALTEVVLAPGDAVEADIPIGSVYSMRKGDAYRVQASCEAPGGGRIRSNEIQLKA